MVPRHAALPDCLPRSRSYSLSFPTRPNVLGDYTQQPDGTLAIELAGTAEGGRDVPEPSALALVLMANLTLVFRQH